MLGAARQPPQRVACLPAGPVPAAALTSVQDQALCKLPTQHACQAGQLTCWFSAFSCSGVIIRL